MEMVGELKIGNGFCVATQNLLTRIFFSLQISFLGDR